MRGVARTLLTIITGFVIGLCIGPISILAINARDRLRSNEKWPEWSQEYVLILIITSIPAGINGALGAGLAYRWGIYNRRPVTILPIALHVIVGLGTLVAEPQSFLGLQWYTLVFTAIIWFAGRLGQRVGCMLIAQAKRGVIPFSS